MLYTCSWRSWEAMNNETSETEYQPKLASRVHSMTCGIVAWTPVHRNGKSANSKLTCIFQFISFTNHSNLSQFGNRLKNRWITTNKKFLNVVATPQRTKLQVAAFPVSWISIFTRSRLFLATDSDNRRSQSLHGVGHKLRSIEIIAQWAIHGPRPAPQVFGRSFSAIDRVV